jgi:hypothetical protein
MKPDYNGGSIVNLMASIINASGGKSQYKEAKLLPAKQLQTKRILLLAIDGLGDEWLARYGKESFLATHRVGKLTSVFPSTTAAAMTAIYTGVPPARHGFTGWYMFFRELGMVIAPLPPWSRAGKIETPQADASALLKATPIFEKISKKGVLIVPSAFTRSPYNQFIARKARPLTYNTLRGWINQTRKALRLRGNRFILSYWPGFDTLFHEKGSKNKQLHAHFWELDAAIQRLANSLDKETVLVITADHGLIDTSKNKNIKIEEHSKLSDCLALPLCGEHRIAYAYLKPGMEQQFKREMAKHKQAIIKKSSLMSAWFGPGKACKELPYRIGDYTIIMKENWTISDLLLDEKPNKHIGRHGGTSKEEMLVPLIIYQKHV